MEFTVLKCCECFIFQVHSARKGRNWNCKMCGMKQSVMKVHFQGSSGDCRKIVQSSNMMAGQKRETNESFIGIEDSSDEDRNLKESTCALKPSKWEIYKPAIEIESSDEQHFEDNIVTRKHTQYGHNTSTKKMRKRPSPYETSPSKHRFKDKTNYRINSHDDVYKASDKRHYISGEKLVEKSTEASLNRLSKWGNFCP